ncbi:hypothetical protein WDZ92_06565 [Nostoc sp. NIES-2111]
MAEKSEIKELLDQSSGINRSLGLVFAAFMVYLGITVWGTNDLILTNETVRLPILDIGLPPDSFFTYAPWVLVMVHLNLLLNLKEHNVKLARWVEEVYQTESGNPDLFQLVQQRLHPFLFNVNALGLIRRRLKAPKLSLGERAAVVLTQVLVRLVVYYLPPALLVSILMRYSCLHLPGATRWHFAALLVDLSFVSLFAYLLPSPRGGENRAYKAYGFCSPTLSEGLTHPLNT